MALPSNYKQIAVGAPTGPPTPATSGGTSGSSRSRSSGAGGGGDRNKDTTPIFTHSNYGNPAFTPQKAGKSSSSSKTQSESRTPKPPKPPEKPILPYMRFSKRIWDSVKSQHPELKLWELGKKIGALWKQLNETEKQEYLDEYEADKVEYEKALKAYHNSPAYLTYMAAKNKVKTDADVHETPSRSGGKGQQERRIDIQPAEDEDDQDEGYTFKHIAYARYLRNHRLINEIFSDAVVPDVRSVVTTQRMQVLKRQVSSLTMHQTKLEAELQQMEEKFEAKKQRMVESSEAFQEELKRHCKPAVDDEKFQKMVQKMYEEMRRDRQRLEMEAPMGGGAGIGAAGGAAVNVTPSHVGVPPHVGGLPHAAPHAALAAHRPEEKPMVAAAPAVLHSEGNTPAPAPVIAKKEATSMSPLKSSHESSSKTDPEPMDIEPTPKPSVPLPPKSETRPTEPLALPQKAMSLNAEHSKEPMHKHPAPIASPGKPITAAVAATPPAHTPPPPPSPAQLTATVEHLPAVTPPATTPPAPTNVANQAPIAPPTSATAAVTATQQHQQQQPPPPQQQPIPSTMPMHPHVAPPSHPHMPPHMPPHQPISGMPPHAAYGNYGAPSGPTRSPYYQPQYGAHPAQPYGQYAPYSHYQQPYGPPPGSHYMNARPPPQHNGSPVHYPGDHNAPVGQPPQQQPPPGHMSPHDVYGQPHGAVPPQQQSVPPQIPQPTTAGASASAQQAAGGEALGKQQETDKKESE